MMVVVMMMITNGAITMFIIMTMYVYTFIVEGLFVCIYIRIYTRYEIIIYL
jgi:hypothetical protein